ncbi:NEDD4 family-interacting 1 [Brachionus plicatilis]|uniref:NEDD4 family-interacting 1 n=1 Tax=Brachionus plicatilis TaxID=10195 RepID=A0A3M7QE55_BRAPC|nr:NEDD4 family-interacting 1 [Brachionus plicatilis]
MSRSRYHLLPNEDQNPALEVNLAQSISGLPHEEFLTEVDLSQNPRNELAQAEVVNVNLTPLPQSGENMPPISELPSYTEALRIKNSEAHTNELPPGYFSNPNSGSTETRFPVVDNFDLRAFTESDLASYDQDIGSECMFLSAFMIAFFFNWVGFFAAICLIPNAAGKYGALSGFGLSMAKWVTIFRYQEWMVNMNDFQQKLFVWLFIFLGFYLFFRGLINYMTLKYRPRGDLNIERRNRWITIMD